MRRNRRTRLFVRSVIVVLVLAGSWIGVMTALQLLSSKDYEFRNEAAAIFTRLSRGDGGELWEASSAGLRERIGKQRLVALSRQVRDRLGEFRGIASVTSTYSASDLGRVAMRVEFANATIPAALSFIREDERWKLLGLTIEVPRALSAAFAADETKDESFMAPGQFWKSFVGS